MMGYTPNRAQSSLHAKTPTVLQIVGAEGAGKSHVTAAEITACVPWSKLIYLIGQTYENTHVEFNYLVENLLALGALDLAKVSQPRQGSWHMTTKTGCQIVTLSVERGASAIIAKGEQPDVFALLEAGIINSFSVMLASTRRATRSRGRVILSGTLKDNFGWYASLVDELTPTGNAWQGQTYSLPAWTNTILYPGGRDDPEIKRLESILPDDEFKRTIAAQRVPSRALIFPEFSYSANVKPCPYDPDLPVHLWIDPGYYPSAYAVIPVQLHGPEVWQIDEVYLHHHTHQQVIEVCQDKPWWPAVKRGVIDVAGKQHHAEDSAVEVWYHVTGLRLHSKSIGVLDGIARHRTFLAPTPRLFHDPKCKHTLAEYKRYKRRTDRDGNPTSDEPIDDHNHAMKAIAYGLVDRFGFVDNRRPALAGMIAQGSAKGWAAKS
jgi:hypothetical protein